MKFYCDDNACWGERKCKKQCGSCYDYSHPEEAYPKNLPLNETEENPKP